MKIRLIDDGYRQFTGMFGSVEFKDGVSVGDVASSDARLLAAVVGVEVVGGDIDLSASAEFQAAKDMPASTTNLPTVAELIERGEMTSDEPQTKPEPFAQAAYTRDDLEKIADKSGIAGLRAIGDPLGVRANSIANLITAILKALDPPKPEAAPLAEGQPEVVTYSDDLRLE